MRTTDRLRCCLRHAEVPDFAFLDQVLNRPRHLFDRHLWVHAVLVVEVDGLDAEPPERALGGFLDVLRPTGQVRLLSVGVELEAELVAITTWSRKGKSASPTSSSLTNGP